MALKQDSETPKSTEKTIVEYGSHSLNIQGFSFKKGMGVGKYISSNSFPSGGHSWIFKFYPDGEVGPDETGGEVYVSVYINMLSKSKSTIEVEAYHECSLLDHTGNTWTKRSGPRKTKRSGPRKFTTNNSWGYQKFYKRSELENSQFIKDDCLTIQYTVGVVKTIIDHPRRPVAQLSELGGRIGQLLENKETSDITFVVEGETFYAHKAILSTWSPVFRAQFYGPLKEKNAHCIKIEEIQAPVFKALLHYIYCGVISDGGENLMGVEFTMMIQHLLVVADRYGSERLKSLCESTLCENIEFNIVASTLALAEQYGCTKLKSMCIEFIILPENTYAVMQTDGYKNLKESCPSVLEDLIKSLVRKRDCTYVTYGQE